MRNVYSPSSLADEWVVPSATFVTSGALRAFTLGAKLLRIPANAVEKFRCGIPYRTATRTI